MGETLDFDPATGRIKVDVKNRFALGDKLEIIEPQGNQDMILEAMWNMNGEPIDVAMPVNKAQDIVANAAKSAAKKDRGI